MGDFNSAGKHHREDEPVAVRGDGPLGVSKYIVKGPAPDPVFMHDLKQPCACKTCETQLRLDDEAHARKLAEAAKLAQERPTLDLRLDGPKPDVVNHPPHYKSGGLEVFDVLRAFGLLKSFTLGNVVKYVLRAGRKGDALEDLKKARWYLDEEIKEREDANKP